MNTDDPHLKCHLMSQIILHICPHHHVIVLNLRCRRSCHNANENLRNNGMLGFRQHLWWSHEPELGSLAVSPRLHVLASDSLLLPLALSLRLLFTMAPL